MRISDWSSDVCSSDLRPVGAVAQGGVQHRAALRRIDLLAAEHGLARALDIGGARQGQQLVQRLRQDEVLRIIEQQIVESQRKALEALGVLGEEVAQAASLHPRPPEEGRVGKGWSRAGRNK